MDNQSWFSKLRRFDAYPKTLEDFRVKTFGGAAGSSMYQYFVKIVPTTYTNLEGQITRSNQYSVTKHEKQVSTTIVAGDQGLPGVFVLYELSPLIVKYKEVRRSFMHFLTGVCTIIGGIFTVAGLIDSAIYHSARAIQKKIDLGKAL